MKKYLAIFLLAFFLLCSTKNVNANVVPIANKGKTVKWTTEDVIKPTSGEVKTYSPIYKEEKFYYGYWDNGEWIVHDGEKELFRAIDEKVWVFSSVPQYFSYWVKTNNGKKMVLQDALGNKIPIPDNTAYVDVVQKYTEKLDSFVGEVYFQYWLNDKQGYKKGAGTVIRADGTTLFPIDYYSLMIPYWILDEGWFIIKSSDKKELLFKDGNLIKKADAISKIYKDRYDLWLIVNGDTNSFINLQTGWTFSTKDKILFKYNTEVFLVNSRQSNIEGGSNYGELKIFKLDKESFTDITPIKEKIVFATYIFVKEHNTILQKFLVFAEGDKYGKIISFLKNGSWSEHVEQTTIEMPIEKEINFAGAWDIEKNSYRFRGTALDPQFHPINFSYTSDNKTAMHGSSVKGKPINTTGKYGMIGTGEYYSFYQEYDSNEKRSKIVSLVLLSEKDKSVLLEKDVLQDGFVDSGKSPMKFFYQENNKWFFYDGKEEKEYALLDIEKLFTVDNADLAVYRTDKEQGLFLFYNKEKIALPKGLEIISLVSGSAKEQSAILKVKEKNREKLVRFNWQ